MKRRKKTVRHRKKKSQSNLFETLSHLFHPRRSNNHRPHILHPEALLYLIIIIIGAYALLHTVKFFPSLKDSILGFASNITPSQVIELSNEQRAKSGLEPLTYNEQLSQAALAKAQDMFNDQYWAHTAPDGREPWAFIKDSNYVYSVAGENLARDFADTPTMLAAWMNSPTHRANIMNAKYEETGIAVVDGKLQGFETTLVVQMFGKPKGASVAQINDEAIVQKTAPETISVLAQEPIEIKPITNENNEKISIPTKIPQKQIILAGALVPIGSLSSHPLFTPLQITKAIFLSVIILIIMTLAYDGLVVGHTRTARLVGKNFAHIVLFSFIAFLVVFFKGGMIE